MLFDLGSVVATPAADALMKAGEKHTISTLLSRHAGGDWGDISEEDRGINDESVKHGWRILSVYKLVNGTVWVITEHDRSATTFLLPSEY